MTEDEIVHDLLVRRFHDEHFRRLVNPAEAALEELKANPKRGAGLLERAKRATLESAGFQRALQALGMGAKTTEAPAATSKAPRRGLTLRIGTKPKERPPL